MTFTFTLTKQAHVRAVQDVTRRTLAYKLSWVIFVFLPMVWLLLIAVSRQDLSTALWTSGPYFVIGPLVLLIGFPLAHRLSVYQMHRHNLASASCC
jgi:Flp pilus assembly protein protease CpaA